MKWALATLLLSVSLVTQAAPAIERAADAVSEHSCCADTEDAPEHDDGGEHNDCPMGCGHELCVCITCPIRTALTPVAVTTLAAVPTSTALTFPSIQAPSLDGSARRVFHPPKV